MEQINAQSLRWFCNAKPSQIGARVHARAYFKKGETDRRYWFRDNGSDILAVSHLDTVLADDHWFRGELQGDKCYFSTRLDNRLGAYLISDYLPSLGVKCDLLLTTGEEQMKSTASLFRSKKKYKWAFSFDRAGSDVVLYQYDCADLRARVVSAGATVGMGSYSDIRELSLGCVGTNWGNGTHHAHMSICYVDIPELTRMVSKFLVFYNQNDIHLTYTAPVYAKPLYPVVNSYKQHKRGLRQKSLWKDKVCCSTCGNMVEDWDYSDRSGMCWRCVQDSWQAQKDTGRAYECPRCGEALESDQWDQKRGVCVGCASERDY